MVPTGFWEQVRAEITKVKPGAILLAEASKPELLVKTFDIDYAWPLLSTMNDVLMHGSPASNIRQTWEKSCAQFPKDSLHMMISDDHDEVRAVSRYGVEGALAASALMFTLDGVPLIYNGMEVGDTAQTAGSALFARLPIAWASQDRVPLRNIYHDLIQLRHQYAALHDSRVDWLHNSDEARLLSFLRADDKDDLLIVINFSRGPVTGKVDLKNADNFAPVRISGVQSSDDGLLPTIRLRGFEWRIYRRGPDSMRAASAAAAHGN
jgi:glycosidase